jgi:hypothetical protein
MSAAVGIGTMKGWHSTSASRATDDLSESRTFGDRTRRAHLDLVITCVEASDQSVGSSTFLDPYTVSLWSGMELQYMDRFRRSNGRSTGLGSGYRGR